MIQVRGSDWSMGYHLEKEAIEAARKAYDNLTEEQKKKIPADKLKILIDEEKDLAEAEKTADAINNLPLNDNMGKIDKIAIEAARRSYDALSGEQKKIISADILKKLIGAEKALAEVEKKTQKQAWVQKHLKNMEPRI